MALDPGKFFDAVREYDKSANNDESKGWNRCGTVDSEYTGVGPARILFDGETTLSQKFYHFVGTAPRAGTRVFLAPVGSTYVIQGMINGGV
jgi:hypothetical protein